MMVENFSVMEERKDTDVVCAVHLVPGNVCSVAVCGRRMEKRLEQKLGGQLRGCGCGPGDRDDGDHGHLGNMVPHPPPLPSSAGREHVVQGSGLGKRFLPIKRETLIRTQPASTRCFCDA